MAREGAPDAAVALAVRPDAAEALAARQDAAVLAVRLEGALAVRPDEALAARPDVDQVLEAVGTPLIPERCVAPAAKSSLPSHIRRRYSRLVHWVPQIPERTINHR